jgi:hypothetical protein
MQADLAVKTARAKQLLRTPFDVRLPLGVMGVAQISFYARWLAGLTSS